MKADGGLRMKHDNDYTIGLKNIWEVVCYGSDGQEKWREINKNLVTTGSSGTVLVLAAFGLLDSLNIA